MTDEEVEELRVKLKANKRAALIQSRVEASERKKAHDNEATLKEIQQLEFIVRRERLSAYGESQRAMMPKYYPETRHNRRRRGNYC